MKHLFLTLTLFVTYLCSLAQAPRLYSTAQGLSDTHINHITFDSNNFLWISTSMGLSRFDGQMFTNYIGQETNPFSLHSNNVSMMHEDADGLHWIGAGSGFFFLCRTENRFEQYIPDSVSYLGSISCIIDDPIRPHHLIVGTFGYGVHIFDTESRRFLSPESSHLSHMLHKYNVPLILADAHHRLWGFFHQGFKVIDLDHLEEVPLSGISDAHQQEIIVQACIEDRLHDCLYLGTINQGLYRCHLGTMTIEEITVEELRGKNITALAFDPKGNLIVGTECQGLYSVEPLSLVATQITPENSPVDLNRAKVHSIAYDDQQNLWLGIFQSGLLVIPSHNNLFNCRPITDGGSNSYNLGCVSCFTSLSDGTRIFGIDGGGLSVKAIDGRVIHYDHNNSPLANDAVMTLATTPQDETYAGIYQGGIFRMKAGDKPERVPELEPLNNVSVMSLVYDTLREMLYIGTNGMALYSYHPASATLRQLSDDQGHRWIASLYIDHRHRLWVNTQGGTQWMDLDRLDFHRPKTNSSIRVYGMEEDPIQRQIWLATDKGLMSYDEQGDTLRQLLGQQLLPSESFLGILRNRDGRLWLSSNYGISCYDPTTQRLTRYSDPEITKVGSFAHGAYYAWPDGQFSFGGDNGVLTFQPDQVTAFRRPVRPIYFTRLWINSQLTDYDPAISPEENMLDEALWKAKTLRLPPTSNSFTIAFAVQEYCDPVNIRYEYHLEGYEKDWHQVHSDNASANYASLPSGEYTLQVRAYLGSNLDDQQVTKELTIIVLPYWYETTWAHILWVGLAVAFITLVILYLRYQHNQRRLRLKAKHIREVKDAKLRMFAAISNELRSPLTLIISPLRELMNRHVDGATHKVYETIYNNALHIFMLVNQQNNIADANKTVLEELEEAKRQEEASKTVDENQLVGDLQNELQEKIRLRERRSNMSFNYNTVEMESADEKLLQRVVDCIHRHLSDPDFSVETLSEESGISRVHLNRKLKELIDTSPSALIKSVRLKQAAVLLVRKNATVAEIAYSVGYSSPAYFSNNFAQYFGMTPKEFITAYNKNPDSPELKKVLE